MDMEQHTDDNGRISDGLFVAMTTSMKRDLAALAAREHRTMSSVIRLLVERRLARRRRERQL